MSAFLYLVWTSGRNRAGRLITRVRSPRYAAALIVGGLYLWSFLVRPIGRASATPAFLGQPTEMIVTLLAVLTLMGSWLFGSDATALAFSRAEVSMLFPAPLSRRSLIVYKLFRAQVAVLVNALIWVFVLRRGGTILPSPLRAIGLWVLFSTLNLHRLGAALVRSSWREHGKIGARRHRGSIVVSMVIAGLIGAGLFEARGQLFPTAGVGSFFIVLGTTLAKPPAYWGLYPFHLSVAPTFARSVSDWGHALVPALGVLVAHAWWVLRTDAAFEDAAIDASSERGRRADATRSRRTAAPMGVSRATPTLRLAPSGHPGWAIFWKNMLCLRRTKRPQVFVGPGVMALAIGAAMSGDASDGGETIAAAALALAAMLLVFGGRFIRNDLRHDMQHLPLLKTLPIPPGQIVLAEVASAALPMAAAQMTLVLIAYLAVFASPSNPLGGDVRLALLLAAPFALTALNGALLTIQNGMAVLFPAWIRLGPTVSTGVEALGQNVLATAANLFSLAAALIVPAIAAWGTVVIIKPPPPPSALALAVSVAAAILAAETYAAMRFLGGALARAEPVQTE